MDTLYKFVASQQAVRSLAAGSLKFTETEKLNDPSELVPLMNRQAVQDSLRAMRQSGYTEEQFKWLGCQEATLRLLSPETIVIPRPATIERANATLSLPVYDNLDLMERQLLKTIALIRSRVGILSLTASFNSLPMWAHYAAGANGYVVRFSKLGQMFAGDATGSLNSLKPMKYVDDIAGMTHDPSTQDNLFFCKFQDWSYEREWRVVTPLAVCSYDKSKSLYLRSIDSSHITGVICGWNVGPEDVTSLTEELRRVNPAVEVSRAAVDRGRIVVC